MTGDDMSALDILESFLQAYRRRDVEIIRSLCKSDITYISVEGLVAEGIEEFMLLIQKEFDSFSIAYEPLSWQKSHEKASECLISWKRGVQFVRNAALRRVELLGTALIVKSKETWSIAHLQYSVPVSFRTLFRKTKTE
jgi:hypothetical protein